MSLQQEKYKLIGSSKPSYSERSHGVMVSTQDSESCNPSSNLGGTLVFLSALRSMRMEPGGRASISIKSGLISSAIPCGLVVRIRRFHRRGRGSIPRMGEHFFLHLECFIFYFLSSGDGKKKVNTYGMAAKHKAHSCHFDRM